MITPGLVLFALQLGRATLAGTITDRDTGAPIPGATVVLSDLQRVLVTDVGGRYSALHVAAGPQHVTVRSIGYLERTLHAFVPRAGTLELNIALNSQPIALQPTEVRAHPTMRGLESAEQPATLDRVIGIAAVRNHPLLAEPDVFQVLVGGEVTARPESPSGLHVRGSASDQVAYLLDGIPVFSP
ncbi:MAG: carboxypeptidase regulatory-like domain-containing protein, partial [Longimicrobiales bacterium]